MSLLRGVLEVDFEKSFIEGVWFILGDLIEMLLNIFLDIFWDNVFLLVDELLCMFDDGILEIGS